MKRPVFYVVFESTAIPVGLNKSMARSVKEESKNKILIRFIRHSTQFKTF
jgi:hypothetical protein